jgi:HlyD family secretion protein
VVIAAVASLSIYYLVRGQPLLVQGEVDATRFDIAARVDGRVGEVAVLRGQNVNAKAVLVRIDNPETVAKHEQAAAAKVVADAQLANINVGTRPEVIAARKAALERAQAALVLAQQTHERVRQLAERGNAPQARLDQTTDALHESERVVDQAKSAYEQAVNGYTARNARSRRRMSARRRGHQGRSGDHRSGWRSTRRCLAGPSAMWSPASSSPGVPLVTLIDLSDSGSTDLREDQDAQGRRPPTSAPALGDRHHIEVKLIATKGEYASWRATALPAISTCGLFDPRLSGRQRQSCARHERSSGV